MKRILYAWELGAGLGHIAAFLPVAESLRQRGHEILCATRDTGTTARIFSLRQLPWLQAPYLGERPSPDPLHNYTDILLRYGFADATGLLGHIGSWLSIFELYRPQLIVADHAPAALFAAKLAGQPAMLFGTGFCCPPPTTPMPPMRPWETVAQDELQRSERVAVASMSSVAELLGRPAPISVSDILRVAESAVLGFPEIDHYAQRDQLAPNARYWGVIGDAGMGDRPRWPATPGRRLFVYVRPACPHLAALFHALAELCLPTLVYCPGASENQLAVLRRHSHVAVAAAPVDLAAAFSEADAAVTNGSFSSSAGFLRAGKPVMVLPTHLEQYLLGWRIEQNGLGHLFTAERPATELLGRLYRVASDPLLRRNTEAFAARYRDFDQPTVVHNMTERIIALAS